MDKGGTVSLPVGFGAAGPAAGSAAPAAPTPSTSTMIWSPTRQASMPAVDQPVGAAGLSTQYRPLQRLHGFDIGDGGGSAGGSGGVL